MGSASNDEMGHAWDSVIGDVTYKGPVIQNQQEIDNHKLNGGQVLVTSPPANTEKHPQWSDVIDIDMNNDTYDDDP